MDLQYKNIYFLTPYKSRDLEANCLIGYILEKKYGCNVFYFNGYDVEEKILNNNIDLIIFDHLEWGFKANQLKFAKKLGIITVVIPTEGLFFDEKTVRRVVGEHNNISQYVDLHFTWGKYVNQIITNNNLIQGESIISGCHRFDFYSKKYSKLYSSKEDFLKSMGFENPYSPTILWATNTVYLSRNHKKIIKSYSKKSNWTEKEIKNVIQDELNQFNEQKKIICRIAEERKDWNIIIKIHPAEWVSPYIEFEKNYSNIKIQYNKPIKEFLKHCDLVIQRNCSVASEAWMNNKPVLQTQISNYNRIGLDYYLKGNKLVNTYEQAHETIIEYLENKSKISNEQLEFRENFLKTYYSEIDGFAFARIAYTLNELIQSNVNPQKDELIKSEKISFYRQKDKMFSNRLKSILGINRKTSLRFWKTFFNEKRNDKTEGELEATREEIEKIYGNYEKINLLSIYEDFLNKKY